jgi:glycosyltransferase involved in cell wall biosynthesis
MKTMKVGIWLHNDYTPMIGGGYSYNDVLIEAIDKHTFSDTEVVFISENSTIKGFHKDVYSLPSEAACSRLFKKFLQPFLKGFHRKLLAADNRNKERFLVRLGIDVVFYPVQGYVPLSDFPFILNNWDIGHCSTYAFPEVMQNGEFETREDLYSKTIHKALCLFVESEAGKNELVRYTGINPDRVKVVPIFAGRAILTDVAPALQQQILDRFGIKRNEYFFYPAQFWAHKNHYGLMVAMKHFLQKHPTHKLVFTGGDQGNLAYLNKVMEQFCLTEHVVLGGFVSLQEIAALYRNATALVMPSYIGPTNMPLLEALTLKCPVLCSRLDGHVEIMRDAALYFAPINHNEIADCMEAVMDQEQRNALLKKADTVFAENKFTIDGAISAIDKHFSQLTQIRQCWG